MDTNKELRKVYCYSNNGQMAWAYKDDNNEEYQPNILYQLGKQREMTDKILEGHTFRRWLSLMEF